MQFWAAATQNTSAHLHLVLLFDVLDLEREIYNSIEFFSALVRQFWLRQLSFKFSAILLMCVHTYIVEHFIVASWTENLWLLKFWIYVEWWKEVLDTKSKKVNFRNFSKYFFSIRKFLWTRMQFDSTS